MRRADEALVERASAHDALRALRSLACSGVAASELDAPSWAESRALLLSHRAAVAGTARTSRKQPPAVAAEKKPSAPRRTEAVKAPTSKSGVKAEPVPRGTAVASSERTVAAPAPASVALLPFAEVLASLRRLAQTPLDVGALGSSGASRHKPGLPRRSL